MPVGHREELLAAARRLLEERGYAHITARDLVAASNTNLASIGYHFGSKAALLNAAIEASFDDWTEQLAAIVMSDPDAPGGNYYHWVVVDLPAGSTGVAADLPTGARELRNSGGHPAWTPPCPPSGTHHYRFTAYALSAATGLPADASLEDAFAAISRGTIAQGTLTGLVSH